MEPEDKVKERKNKVSNWIKDNQLLIAILVFAFLIRLYYFFLTKDQTLWWDEAEYMSHAKNIAFGITPGKVSEDFAPGLERNVDFAVVNSEKKDMGVLFYIKGNLKYYVKLSKQFDGFGREEESKSYTHNVKLPDKLNPGKHVAEIVALELPQSSYLQDSTFVEEVMNAIR